MIYFSLISQASSSGVNILQCLKQLTTPTLFYHSFTVRPKTRLVLHVLGPGTVRVEIRSYFRETRHVAVLSIGFDGFDANTAKLGTGSPQSRETVDGMME